MVNAYRRIIKITMFITAISMFFLGAISEPLLFCLIGSKWQDASYYLPLICISGSLYPLHAINLNMLQVQGRSDLFLGLEFVKKAIGFVPLSVCVFYGIMPMLYVNLVTGPICFFINSHYSGKMIGYSSLMQLRDIAPSYGIAIIIALSVYFLKYLPFTYWVILPLQFILGVLVLIVLVKRTKSEEFVEIQMIIKPYLSILNK
jgi:O-antigen/teichoic acid export membrane protein